jgi:hypothetical protein
VRHAAPNHLWDTEVIGIVAACIFKVLVAMQEVKS